MIIHTIYSQKHYYERVKTMLNDYLLSPIRISLTSFQDILAFLRAVWKLGVLEKGKRYFWKLLFFALKTCPEKFHIAVNLAILGFHYRKIMASIFASKPMDGQQYI